MPRGGQVARLHKIIMVLAQRKRGVPALTLARRLEQPLRTVYRDLRALEAAGYPVVSDKGSRWRFRDGWQTAIPFPLPPGELLALVIARKLMRPLAGTPVARDFEALSVRLLGETLKGAAQGELFTRYRSILATHSTLAIDYSEHTALIEALCLACEQRRTVRVVYFVETRNELTQRPLDPYSLYYDPQLEALYVFAWCHARQAMRTFAVHRFRQVTLTDDHFEIPADFSVEKYLRGAFRLWREGNATKVRLRLRPGTRWITERRWHASQTPPRLLPNGGCEIEFVLDGFREFKRFVMQLGPEAEVVEPRALRKEITGLHAEAARVGEGVAKEVTALDGKVRAKRARRTGQETDVSRPGAYRRNRG